VLVVPPSSSLQPVWDITMVSFTAHNIRLDDGTTTKPEVGYTIDQHVHFISAKRLLSVIFPGARSDVRLADLGCLEGGYSVEFARLGFNVLGVEVREANIAACNLVKQKTNLPNLTFIHDDAWNIAKYGRFDVVFCCGLFYHFDRPSEFLQLISSVTSKLVILQTHFATDESNQKHRLSEKLYKDNYGNWGRWYAEFVNDESFDNREAARWSSWDNRKSFWLKREYLLQAIVDSGFDLCMEQFDNLGDIPASMESGGYYNSDSRGTFVGIKSGIIPPVEVRGDHLAKRLSRRNQH
jgi:Methyltransferase domain